MKNLIYPIIDPSTLTEEQREEIKDKYEKAPNPYDHQFNVGIGEGWMEAFEWLFGENFFKKGDNMENKTKEIFTKDNIDEIVSSMLEYTAVITQDIINEASKYKPEEERIFIKGAAWMLYHLVKNRGQRHIYIESDMSLDEAIQHCEEVLPLAETAQCAREHVQLRDWLTELKQYRENKQ